MENLPKNLNISIFYNRFAWHKLINLAIKPFIETEQKKGTIKSYYIYLSSGRGEHITVILKPLNYADTEQAFIQYIEQFIAEYPSVTKALEFPLKGLFMNFPNNTVWTDIDNIYSPINRNAINIQNCISSTLIHALGDDEIDTETIYTFLIYAQLGIIKAAYPALKKARKGALALIAYLEGDEFKKDESTTTALAYDYTELALSFQNNTDVLTEIIEDIWDTTGFSPELKWLEIWINSCKEFLANSDFNVSFLYLNKLIHDHVGLNFQTLPNLSAKLILNSFVQLSNSFLSNNKIIRID